MTAIVLDDDSLQLKYAVPHNRLENPAYLNGSAALLSLDIDSELSNLTVLSASFSGTSINIFGQIDQVVSAVVTIDGGNQTSVQFSRNMTNIVHAIYQSPILPDGQHSLTLASSWNALKTTYIIDYVTVTLGEYTQIGADGVLGEKPLIVDEIDTSLIFDGNWIHDATILMENSWRYMQISGQDVTPYRRYPYGGATRQSSSVGASVTFRFNGTSVSIFGVNLLNSSQYINMTYTLDGKPTTKNHTTGNSTNYQWYSIDSLSPTNHTLEMKVGQGQDDAPFNLDYIIYMPSFVSLAEEQGLGSTQPPTSQPSSSQPSPSHTAIPSPTHTMPLLNQPGRGTSLGAIIGPVLGGVVVVILLFMRRKKLAFWSSRESPNIGNIFISSDRIDQAHLSRNCLTWPWRRSANPGLVEAFPSDCNPSNSDQLNVQRKPSLPGILHAEQRASRNSATGTANETIVADTRVQQLEELVFSIQREIEERLQLYGVQNGVHMRALVGGPSESRNEFGRQGNGDHSSVTMSTTVV